MILTFCHGFFWRAQFFTMLSKKLLCNFYIKGKIPKNLISEGLKYPPKVQAEHKTCSTICGTLVKAILDQKSLTRLAGGGQGRSSYGPECASSIIEMA